MIFLVVNALVEILEPESRDLPTQKTWDFELEVSSSPE